MKQQLAALAAALVAAACATTPSAAAQDVAIRFDARSGDRSLQCCETYTGVGRARASVTLHASFP